MKNTLKMAFLPMWVIDRIKEEMRLSPGTWETITKAVEEAEVPEKTACAVRLPPATTFAAGVSVASVLMAIKQRSGLKPEFLEFTQPAPQPHPEPIAWMVGTAIWWTKEEAERDAAASGLSMIPFGPLTGSAEVEQLREVIKRSDAQIMRQSMRISNQRAQLAKQEALLRELIQIAEDREQGYSDRLHGGVVNGKAADSLVMLMGRMKLAVSSDAGPSAAAEHQP